MATFRVLARFGGIHSSIDETATKQVIAEFADHIIDNSKPGDHNQAMMELGATVCTPSNPQCHDCPLKENCVAHQHGTQHILPLRSKKTKVRDRFFYYKVVLMNDTVLINKRPSGDIWQGLYEFPLYESEKRLSDNEMVGLLTIKKTDSVLSISKEYKHVLSHQRIFTKFLLVKSDSFDDSNFIRVEVEKVDNFAFPKLINRYLDDQNLKVLSDD